MAHNCVVVNCSDFPYQSHGKGSGRCQSLMTRSIRNQTPCARARALYVEALLIVGFSAKKFL